MNFKLGWAMYAIGLDLWLSAFGMGARPRPLARPR